MKEALSSSETSALTRATRRNNPEDTTLHSHRRENLKLYKRVIIQPVKAIGADRLKVEENRKGETVTTSAISFVKRRNTHARARAHTHTHTRARAHTHTHIYIYIYIPRSFIMDSL
jgi:hypothetical protein